MYNLSDETRAGMEIAAKIVSSFDNHGFLPPLIAATIRAAMLDKTVFEKLQHNEGKER